MQIFYAPGIEGNTWRLDEKESWHSVRVLRMKKDTNVRIIDGKGNLYEGVIINPDPRKCEIEVVRITRDFEKRPYHLHIGISPLKNPDRFEWFVEKSVEIGIDEITPVICRNTEKRSIKHDRINGIIISAMKQSVKAGITKLNETADLEQFTRAGLNGRKLIANCSENHKRISIWDAYEKNNDVVILIGPEGDFTPDEITLAVKTGFVPVHMGKSRLRSETAGVAACHSIYFLNQ